MTQANDKEYTSRLSAVPTKLTPKQTALKASAQKSFLASQNLLAQAKQTTNVTTKKSLLVDASKNGQNAIDILAQLNNLTPIKTNTTTVASNANSNDNKVKTNTNPPNNNTTNPPKNNNATNNVKLNVEGLEIKNLNAYSTSRPIPIDEKMQDGLVFKVQLGAFKTAFT